MTGAGETILSSNRGIRCSSRHPSALFQITANRELQFTHHGPIGDVPETHIVVLVGYGGRATAGGVKGYGHVPALRFLVRRALRGVRRSLPPRSDRSAFDGRRAQDDVAMPRVAKRQPRHG